MSATDGAYIQVEKFVISVRTKNRGITELELSYEELVALRDVADSLIQMRDEARLWPFGELEKRAGHLPATRG